MHAWTEKYRPQKLKDVVGSGGIIETILEWVNEWKKGIPKKRAVLLYGPAGVGKTSIAYALANELNYDRIELNASDTRTSGVINRIVGSASSQGTLSQDYEKKIIIIDEVDGIHGNSDRGGMNALKKWINESMQPIVLIANDPWSLPPDLRFAAHMVGFKRIDQRAVLKVLKDICANEKIEADEQVLKIIATNSNGDLRSAINDLQALAEGKKALKIRDAGVLTMRDSEIKIFDTLARIFKTESCDPAREAVNESNEEPDTIMKWIAENLPREYESYEDLATAFDRISRADVFMGRILRTQDWGLLPYAIDLMSAGVATAKKQKYTKFTKYQYPQIFALYSQTKKRRESANLIAAKISLHCHCSKKDAKAELIPLVEVALNKNFEMGARMASELDFTPDDVRFFVESESLAEKLHARAREITAARIMGSMTKVKQFGLSHFTERNST